MTKQVWGFEATRSIAGLQGTYLMSSVIPCQQVVGAQTVWLSLICVWSVRIASNVLAALLRVHTSAIELVRESALMFSAS